LKIVVRGADKELSAAPSAFIGNREFRSPQIQVRPCQMARENDDPLTKDRLARLINEIEEQLR